MTMTDTPGKEQTRTAIAAIARKYAALTSRERTDYTEQQMRIAFILPLFRALGWDDTNPKEVSAEEQIATKFLDFGFYLNGVSAFYLETKRANAGLDKPEHAKQAVNYAYMKGVTWAVLTDFERLMVFNAEIDTTNLLRDAIFLDLSYTDYAGEKFERLWLLSRESMQTREIDKVAEDFGRKAKRQPVTEVLFKQLTTWRYELFKELRGYGDTLWSTDNQKVDNAVQRFLDRLIFIRTMEDRRVENPRLKEVLRTAGKANPFEKLLELFKEMDGIYNSNLFAQSELDLMKMYNPDLIRDIIKGLYDVPGGYGAYDFSAIEADVLGAIYEQYLGFKAQDPEGKQALDPRKQVKRKAQGIYYTPKYVVRYIVANTLGKRLAELRTDPAAAHRLKVVDPACGSGSFLIDAFDVLDAHFAAYGDTKDKDFPRQRRLRILQENLYGVDLDEQAVEVTRLNLALRAALAQDKLPTLDNIRHGNSLIDDEAVAGKDAFNWAEKFPEVFAQGGFDVVVGNPPYVRQELLGADFKTYAAAQYETYAGTADLYTFFIEKSIKMLRPDGIYGVIVANKWMRAGYGKGLRGWLSKQTLREIIDFGDLPVFAEATTYPCILIAQPTLPPPLQTLKNRAA